ncbi:cupin domain-containing protein [Roseimicrobium sp. ORNL1]|uniref:cupin domain-containing protein n=1 Tax=Roseimicrobium sp. ORNL1 TaxID=2711231 RepID=UPI00197FEC9E|nr:cupin domain-containing protein [Roseimicrobium sp. ORNL1]
MTAPDPTPAPPAFPHIELKDLFNIVQHEENLPWQYFRDGVDIVRLYGDGITGPTAALIRFRREGRVPTHYHDGWEHIFVLAGSQRDQSGTIHAGTLRIHPPGTHHSVVSEAGCIVLAIYEKPVKFLGEKAGGAAAVAKGESEERE